MTTADLRTLDIAHVWHPFTQMRDFADERAPVILSGQGRTLVDTEGNTYLDGISALWCNVHGYRVPEIDRAIRSQLEQIAHTTLLGLSNPPSIELAARLATLAPGDLQHVFYSDSGSTAVEVALKIAYQYWQHVGRPEKQRFAALSSAYHGDTIGSVSVGGIDLFHRTFDKLLFDSVHLPTPHTYRPPEGHTPASWGDHCAREAERLIAHHASELAAMVIEPLVQGAAGMITHPPGFLRRVAEACSAHDVLLVCDEVATGFGRTGTMFAVEQEEVTPDLMCVAKGLTGGYLPLAATLATPRVYDAFLAPHDEGKQFFHGHTYTGNALACAAALASLDLFESRDVLGEVRRKIPLFAEGLAKIATLPHVGDVRQRGMMVGIELVEHRETHTPYPPDHRMGHQVILEARRRGVISRPLGDVVVLMPALSMSDDELHHLCATIHDAIRTTTEA